MLRIELTYSLVVYIIVENVSSFCVIAGLSQQFNFWKWYGHVKYMRLMYVE